MPAKERGPRHATDHVETPKTQQAADSRCRGFCELATENGDLRLRKARTISTLGLLFGSLLVVITAYAVLTHDKALLADILVILKAGLLYIALWAGGSSVLRALGRLRFDR